VYLKYFLLLRFKYFNLFIKNLNLFFLLKKSKKKKLLKKKKNIYIKKINKKNNLNIYFLFTKNIKIFKYIYFLNQNILFKYLKKNIYLNLSLYLYNILFNKKISIKEEELSVNDNDSNELSLKNFNNKNL